MGSSDDRRTLVAALRAHGGTGAVCTHLLATLPTIDGAALTVFTPTGRVVVGTSGIGGDRAEDLQVHLAEGPCIDAVRTARPVFAEDLGDSAGQQRWPSYARQAFASGFTAAFSFPVLHDGAVIAAMNLFRAKPGPMSSDEQAQTLRYTAAAAELLADDVTAGGPETGARLDQAVADLQQATGIVMVQAGVDANAALHLIRQRAFDHNRPVAETVADVLARHLRFEATS